ncbi:MAG: TAXI family TRAP transporter solute-binding subunit [Pseudomonadota bacterium]
MTSRRDVLTLTTRAAVLSAALGLGLGSAATAQEEANYILATASTGGTYYPVGVAIATLTKVKLQPGEKIGMAAINSAGSGENVRLLREGEAQFAILQGLFGHFAVTGTGPVEEAGPQDHLRSVSMLWQNVEHFVVPADAAATGTIEDFMALKGSAAALGRQNSGTIGSNRMLLGNLGMNIEEDFELFFAGYGPSAEALQNGQVQALSTPAGVPVGALTQLFATAGDDVRLLSFTEEQMLAADGEAGLWTAYAIPAGTYPGQDYDVTTIAQPNFLATHADVSEEHVYLITKTMYENLPFLQAIHPATRAMAIEQAITGLPAPLHPGALRYYQEVGVEVPQSLIAK